MSSVLCIRTAIFASGERMPLLLGEDGVPLFMPTLFIATEIRARNRAVNTQEQALRAIIALYRHCRSVGIDIEERIRSGEMMTIAEIDGLASALHFPIGENKTDSLTPVYSRSPVLSLERVRARLSPNRRGAVAPQTVAIRLRYIRQYVGWLSLIHLSRLSAHSELRPSYHSASTALLDAINARIPGQKVRSDREGLSQSAITVLMRAIALDCPGNPWEQAAARQRNRLIVLTLYHLGLRAGELLAIKVDDVDFRRNWLTVTRRPDDPEDPRSTQPMVKTLGRKLQLAPELAKELHDYIVNIRGRAKEAAFHPFLFVETDSGRPLSKSALTKVFKTLANSNSSLVDLCPHVLRHTWNDRFSRHAYKIRMSEAEEIKVRSYLMGWRETSGTAATYTKRHVREAATKVFRQLQEMLVDHAKPE